MEWVETTGRTIEEAKDAALDQLGVDEDDAEFEILEEPKSGLFGRIRQEARIRARVRPAIPRAKTERRDRGKRGPRSKSGAGSGPSTGFRETAKSSSESTQGRPAKKNVTKKPVRSSPTKPEGAFVETDMPLTEQGEVAKEFVRGLLAAFDLEGSVEVRELDDDALEVAVTGDNLGLLVGPRGATLSAIQELSRTALQHALSGARGARLRVDVGGYWERRRDALERFAQQVAAQVLESGSSVAMEPMEPADRKIVHDVVNDIDGVQTISDGEDSRRHVVIKPI